MLVPLDVSILLLQIPLAVDPSTWLRLCDISSTLVDIAGGEVPATDGKSLFSVLKGETSHDRERAFRIHQAGGYTQRAIRNKEFKLGWNPEREMDYYLDVLMEPKINKFFAKAWREWLGKAKTDPAAQAKIDLVVKHPEFELYNIQEDP